jgi:hypothetical protein
MLMAQRIAILALTLGATCAFGATLEQLVMPGPVIEGHAELEAE